MRFPLVDERPQRALQVGEKAGTRGPANATVHQGYGLVQPRASQTSGTSLKSLFLLVRRVFSLLDAPVENSATVSAFQMWAPSMRRLPTMRAGARRPRGRRRARG